MNRHQQNLPRMHALLQDKLGMKYVRVYKSMDTGWTTFDTMSERGFRVFVHLTPGELAEDARNDFIRRAEARPVDYSKYEMSYHVIGSAMVKVASNSYGYMVPECIEPDRIKKMWGLAMFFARFPGEFKNLPLSRYSMEEVESGLRQHYEVTDS